MSLSNFLENELLDAVANASAYSAAGVYVKLHLGDPGEDGTANAAAETDRVAASFGAAASGTATSDAAVEWTNVAASETISHISLWDASTAGNCLWTGALTASKAVNAGDTFTIASGDLSLTLS